MDIYSDDNEYGAEHMPMFQTVVDMFEGKPNFQRIVRLGILANMGYSVDYEDTEEDYDFGWVQSPSSSGVHSYGFGGNRASSSSPQPLPRYYGATNANGGGLGASKEEEKAEKKRLKRQKRKERKRNEQQQREKEKVDKTEEVEEKGGNKAGTERPKPRVKEQAAANDSAGSEDSEDDVSDEDVSGSEELDMTSTFVSKARSKLEQKPKPEKEKKLPAKEPKSSPEKPNRVGEKKDSASAFPSSHSEDDNIRTSTALANLGNEHANAGDFKSAVQCYTDAIKHNPREYRLFGNRSFCFERMRLYMKALDDAELSLIMCPGWVKGLFRKGRALAGLKRYEEAEHAFKQVLEADCSRADAAQELLRVQIGQLVGYGYTKEQSAHALNAHKSVKKALKFLAQSNHQPANLGSAPSLHGAPENQKHSLPQTASQNSHHKQELYPIWVGNLFCPVTEGSLEQLFQEVGPVQSVKILSYKRCAFVNFKKQEHCEQAIRRFNGYDFKGTKIAVRYPDRIPSGMGFSRSALTSDLPENHRGRDASGSRRDAHLSRAVKY